MTMESNDVIASIKTAEAEAAEMLRRAEDNRRQGVAQAEQEAARRLAQERLRLQQEHAASVERARDQANKELDQNTREAADLARRLADVPKDRFDRAVDIVLQALREQWQ